MSNIVVYVGACGSGKTLTLRKIARKELLLEKSVLVIASEKFDVMIPDSGDLTVVYNDDIQRVVLAYEIIHNGELPDVLVVDMINLSASDVAFIGMMRKKGVVVHVGVQSHRSAIHGVARVRTDLAVVCDKIYHIETAVNLDGEPAAVVLVPVKSRDGETKSIVVGGYCD